MLNGRMRGFAGKLLALSGFSMALAILSGCGIGIVNVAGNNASAVEGSEVVPAIRINGRAHGGAYPIQNATVVLMETQNTGVWTPSSGTYVGSAKALYATTTNNLGYFSFPDTGWGCDAGQYVYIEVTGGHTTSTTNPNVVQLAVVGSCSADLGNTAEIDGLNVYLSEPSTIAVAYALRPFLSMSSGALTGVPSDGTVTLSNTIPLANITVPINNNAVPVNPSLNPASTSTGAVEVPLTYNTTGIFSDGVSSTTKGFDNDGNAYSGQLVGTTLTYAGVPYVLGPANQPDAVRGGNGVAINLTSGNFNVLNILAAGVNGKQASQTFVVTYTDGSTSTFTQSLSDWYKPLFQNYPGEATALTTSYRDMSNGGRDTLTGFNIYQYSFTINKAKLVQSLTLPNNTNVVVLAVTATANLPTCTTPNTGTALSCTAAGLAHGFQNAYNLVDQVTFSASQFPSGVARTTLPSNSQAIAPREMINTLGNILQECVDSNGGTATSGYTVGTSRCGDLFYYTAPPSTTTYPTNTLQAAINMATYPTNNVSQLMALKPRNVFFSPEIPTINSPQNFAFTLSVFYLGTNLGDTIAAPEDLALDLQDNLYLVYGGVSQNGSPAAIDELTASGTGLFSTALPSVASPGSISLDTNGYVWVSDDTTNTGGVTGLYTSINANQSSAQGSAYKTISVPNGAAAGLAFDASSNMFVTRDSSDTNKTAYLYTAASSYGTSNSYALNYPYQHAAANAQGNFYAVGSNGTNSQWLSYDYATCGTGTAPVTTNIGASHGISMGINNNVGTNASYTAFVSSSGQVNTLNSTFTTFLGNCNSETNTRPAKRQTNLPSVASSGAAMDGNLSFFWSDASTGYIYSMPNVGNSTDIGNATVTSFAPCYYTSGACASTSGANYVGVAIDSSGAIWNLSQGGTYGLVQTLGLAAPTWPLLASENSGVPVQ